MRLKKSFSYFCLLSKNFNCYFFFLFTFSFSFKFSMLLLILGVLYCSSFFTFSFFYDYDFNFRIKLSYLVPPLFLYFLSSLSTMFNSISFFDSDFGVPFLFYIFIFSPTILWVLWISSIFAFKLRRSLSGKECSESYMNPESWFSKNYCFSNK